MIQMVKGTYGRVANGVVEAMTKRSAPFSLSKAREAELIEAGVAVKVEEPAQVKTYNDMSMKELRKVAAELGVDVTAAKSKKDVIALIETAEAPLVSETETSEE